MEYLKYIELNDLGAEQKELAETIGLQNYIKLMKKFGGNKIYIHKPERANIAVRDRFIKNEFNGYNLKDLIKKYNLSEKQLSQIIKEKI